jgi:hypothetical protein
MRSRADVYPSPTPDQIPAQDTAAFSRAAAGVKPPSF